MKLLHLLPVAGVDRALLENLCAAIPQHLPVRCEILGTAIDATPAYHAERQQFHSSQILLRMQPLVHPWAWRLLAVTNVDLYIPILKYIFGEAQMGGPCGVISSHRLRQEFYGLDGDDSLLSQRLLKEAIHELGHTLDLQHCPDYRCAMASAHAVEWIDLRETRLCESCGSRVEAKLKPSMAGKHD